GQLAAFLREVPGFSALPSPFQGTLLLHGPSAISVTGLRGRYNERGEFLITTTPATDENAPVSSGPVFFPHIVDSGGYTTQFILFSNEPSKSTEGVIEFFSSSGK